jgi:hypothetical protein
LDHFAQNVGKEVRVIILGVAGRVVGCVVDELVVVLVIWVGIATTRRVRTAVSGCTGKVDG